MFHNVRFPEEISYGSQGGPKFSTQIVTLASGKERRNIQWTEVRAEFDVSHGIKDWDQLEELRAFFYARMGRAYSFRFKDHGDFELTLQKIGDGDGIRTEFQLIKTYESGGFVYTRKITKPVDGSLGTVTVGMDEMAENTDFEVDYSTGIITFATPPATTLDIVVGSCEFDLHARFDTDHFDPVHEFWLHQSWQSIPVVEIKD